MKGASNWEAPTYGSISWDSLLSKFSMVFQSVFSFADSIENNIKVWQTGCHSRRSCPSCKECVLP